MAKTFDRPITIQKQNKKSELWEDLYPVHASINKASSDNEYLNAGATQSKRSLTFEIRYFSGLKEVDLNRQCYRILYEGIPYNIKDLDDFMLQHKTVKISGESY